MTLKDLIDQVMVLTGDYGEGDIPEIAGLATELELVHQQLARELQVPQANGDVTGITTEFTLPAGAQSGGLLEIRRASDGTPYAIKNVVQANREHAGWQDWDRGDTVFVVQDQKMLQADVRPVPLPLATDPQDYKLLYMVKPTAMTALTSTPFEGRFPQYDEVLAYQVAMNTMLRLQKVNEAQFIGGLLSAMKREFFQATKPGPVYANNQLWKATTARTWGE